MANRVFTVDDGWGWIFTAVEHLNAECERLARSASAATGSPPCSGSPWGPHTVGGVLLHHLGQGGSDPRPVETEPIHAETDCVHRVRSANRGSNNSYTTSWDTTRWQGLSGYWNYGYSFPWCRSPLGFAAPGA